MNKLEVINQTCNLCDALHRNINDNFISVSFDTLENGDIQTKIILLKLTNKEVELINDLMGEFSALQQKDCVLKPIIELGMNPPLKNIVFQNS